MKKLQFYEGGQPFRSTDFALMQDEQITAILATVKAFCAGPCILSGVELQGGVVTEGLIFDGTEVCHVTASGPLHDGELFVLRPVTEQQTPRTFPNGQSHNMVVDKHYEALSVATQLIGDIAFSTLGRLVLMGPSNMLMLNSSTLAFGSTFSGRNGYTAVRLASNGQFGDRMLHADFGANNASGTLCTLPAADRPLKKIIGYFYNGTGLSMLTINTDGTVVVSGASTSLANTISFQFNINFNTF